MILTLDIGGANLKYLIAEGERVVESGSIYLPLWKRFGELEAHLRGIAARAGDAKVGVTMTGELCDIFRSRAEGVERIAEVVRGVFPGARFLSLDMELSPEASPACAGANYVASIYLMERLFGEGILLDIGSTTSDVLPFRRGERLYRRGDLERLLAGQLVYTGMLRTPVCAVSERLPLRGRRVQPAAEVFAIMGDVYLVLGEVSPEEYTCEPPDGGEVTPEAALRRIARMVCSEPGEVTREELEEVCRYLAEKQAAGIAEAVRRVRDAHGLEVAYLGGTGTPLGRRASMLAGIPWVELREHLPASTNLPCLGMAMMLREEGG